MAQSPLQKGEDLFFRTNKIDNKSVVDPFSFQIYQ